ncbi:MAG: dermonecrotic toxin domain-containing protein [Luteibacter jiangsuensis]
MENAPADASVAVRRFDINGYAASDILRFVASDGSEVMYIPGASSPFVTFGNEGELRQWVVRQARDRASLDELLSHFSIYNGQDGAFRTGVSQGLAHLASGLWTTDGRAIDVQNTSIAGDVFEDMRVQVEGRLRDDARMRTSTAWDAWRTTLNRTVAVLGPVGYVPALALPVQAGTALMALGTGIDEGINGRTTVNRNSALEGAVMTVVTNLSTGAAMHGFVSAGRPAEPSSPSTAFELEAVPPSSSVNTGGAVSEPGAQPPAGAEARIAYSMGVLSSDRSAPGVRADTPARGTGGAASLDTSALPSEPGMLGYLVQRVSNDADAWARRIIDLKKAGIDRERHRLDDSRTEPLATNRAGYRQSFARSLVFRVDSRDPAELLRNRGFGPSSDFHDLEPMLRQPTTIGSGSLRASNMVLEDWQLGFSCMACRPSFHQYAVRTGRRPVAAASDNHDPRTYDLPLDEVHFPADVSPANIFIIDSTDRAIARKLADIYRSPYVPTPYGVPLNVFQEYVSGQLDIDAPNKYTGRH